MSVCVWTEPFFVLPRWYRENARAGRTELWSAGKFFSLIYVLYRLTSFFPFSFSRSSGGISLPMPSHTCETPIWNTFPSPVHEPIMRFALYGFSVSLKSLKSAELFRGGFMKRILKASFLYKPISAKLGPSFYYATYPKNCCFVAARRATSLPARATDLMGREE